MAEKPFLKRPVGRRLIQGHFRDTGLRFLARASEKSTPFWTTGKWWRRLGAPLSKTLLRGARLPWRCFGGFILTIGIAESALTSGALLRSGRRIKAANRLQWCISRA